MRKEKRAIILKAFLNAKTICDDVNNLTIDDNDKLEQAVQDMLDLFDARRIHHEFITYYDKK